jgi:energy-coupling factor transporter ATP-binding protein EcfA2
MATLKVSNFGPVRELEWELKSYNIFIGPQAAGKSTIAKLAYYFLTLRRYVKEYITEIVYGIRYMNDMPVDISSIQTLFRARFKEHFKELRNDNPLSRVSFQYQEGYVIELTWKDCLLEIHLSSSFHTSLTEVLRQVNRYVNSPSPARDSMDLKNVLSSVFIEDINANLTAFFHDENPEVIYVPACRSLLAALSDEVYKIREAIDYPSREFIERIGSLKKVFNKSFADVIKETELTSFGEPVDRESLSRIREFIPEILKGEYRYSKEGERLYYSESSYVALSSASSGQQEAVWILQLIFFLVLNNKKTLLLIEEPEAHLFPEVQANMVRLISLFARLNGNRVILTTHSPYILSTANNLLYAAKTGAGHPEEVNRIEPSCCWIDYDRMGVWYVDRGTIESLMEDDIKQIGIERIDEVSSELNRKFDDLLQIDDDEI